MKEGKERYVNKITSHVNDMINIIKEKETFYQLTKNHTLTPPALINSLHLVLIMVVLVGPYITLHCQALFRVFIENPTNLVAGH